MTKPILHDDDHWLADKCAELVPKHEPDGFDGSFNYLGFARDLRAALLERVLGEPVAILTVGSLEHGPFSFRMLLIGVDAVTSGDHNLYMVKR